MKCLAKLFKPFKIKESFHIGQLKPELNKQVEHVSPSLLFSGSFSLLICYVCFILLVGLNKLNSEYLNF